MMWRQLAVIGLVCSCGSCGNVAVSINVVGRDPPCIESTDPGQLIPAIKEGVQKGDRKIIPYLVKDLESTDSAVRFYSIDGLHRLTGEDFGYVYYGDQDAREAAVGRWKEWLSHQKF